MTAMRHIPCTHGQNRLLSCGRIGGCREQLGQSRQFDWLDYMGVKAGLLRLAPILVLPPTCKGN